MLVPSGSSAPVVRLTAPLRALAQRFSIIAFIAASMAALVLGHFDPNRISIVRTHTMDALSPILQALSTPAATAARAVETVVDIANVYEDNARLKAENAKLAQWHQVAERLEAENANLRGLLHYDPEPQVSSIAARVIAAPGGSFVRSVLVTAGARQGVHKGQVAVSGVGLVGRVIEAGEWSARVLLISDINARIPVVLEGSRQRAILAGDNSDQPRLLYLPLEAQVHVGDRVVTSGHGGQLPPGIPVGAVVSVSDHSIKVQTYADMARLDYLRIVDFRIDPGAEAVAATTPLLAPMILTR